MRNLNPIYDAIDSENYDLAIKIIDKAIRKNPEASDSLTLLVSHTHLGV
jgi:hypothetical protein